MAFSDGQISWMRKRLYLTPYDLSMVGTNGTNMTGFETATVTDGEVTNVGMGNFVITDGEFLNGYMPCPQDLDPHFDIGMRVFYTLDHDGTGDATTSWIMLFDAIKIGEAIALPSTVLDTIIPLLHKYVDNDGVSVVTDFLISRTGRGIVTPATLGLTYEDIDDGAFLTFKLELDAAAEETSVRYVGLQLDYRIHACHNPNVNDSPLDHKGDT